MMKYIITKRSELATRKSKKSPKSEQKQEVLFDKTTSTLFIYKIFSHYLFTKQQKKLLRERVNNLN